VLPRYWTESSGPPTALWNIDNPPFPVVVPVGAPRSL
jgi:hypothetical protein